jgi:hypothetical protein
MNIELNNHMPNFNSVVIGSLKLYFSYKTIIGFTDHGNIIVCENIWSKTTGKHLNQIDPSHSNRLDYQLFQSKLNEVLSHYNFPFSQVI